MFRVLALAGVVLLAGSVAHAADTTVTYTKDIAPIVWKNCTGCHRPGEIGPFPLMNYQDAAKRADFLKDVVAKRKMPPWKAEPGFGEFHDVRRLSDAEIATIGRWADDGAEEGNPNDLPAMPRFSAGWQLGEPDLVLKMPEAYEVPAAGRDVFRCFVIPTGLTEDRAVAAVEFRPGNRRVVHHALYFLDSSDQARKKDEQDPLPGYASFGGVGIVPTGALGGWAPGAQPRRLPDGVGRLLRKGSDLVLQIHYHPDGKPESDQSSVGIYFTTTPASGTKVVMGLPISNNRIRIPAGNASEQITAEFTLPVDVHAYGITPHMHWLGKQMKVTATLPDGTSRPLIWIKDWDFNWQGLYVYAAPVALPKGSRITVEAVYDNSDKNPKNPNRPPKDVRFGEQTTDEMCLCAMQVVPLERSGYRELIRALVQMRAENRRAAAALRD
jgi:hypothetical protein